MHSNARSRTTRRYSTGWVEVGCDFHIDIDISRFAVRSFYLDLVLVGIDGGCCCLLVGEVICLKNLKITFF